MLPVSPLSRSTLRRLSFAALLPITLVSAIAFPTSLKQAEAQTSGNRALTLRSDVQEANAKTGVVTARGNVQITYPARNIQATSAQAQYFSRERKIILSGNVYVLQQGNSLRGETITYLIDEGRFVALPQASKQVESIYIVSDPAATPPTPPAISNPPFE